MKLFKLNFDERNMNTIQRICTIMYYINILILSFILIYRQFVLNQSTNEFSDIANLLVLNVIVVISAILYWGGITFPKIRLRILFLIYIVFVAIGFLFTMYKYNILLMQSLSLSEVLEKLVIISVICGLFILIYSLFSYLGHRKIEKDI